MRNLSLAVMFVCLFSLSAAAAEKNQYRSFLSGISCNKVVEGLKEEASQKEFALMIGSYITGSNFAKSRDSQIDLKGMMVITEQYCRQHPGKPVTAALAVLDRAIDKHNERQESPDNTLR